MRRVTPLLALLCLLLALPAAARAAEPPPGSTYTEDFIEPRNAGEERLHVDILRPEGLTDADKTPVILTVSPYTNHAAQVGIDYDPFAEGPSSRFFDFLEAGKVFTRSQKYTYVMVDLRGFGGSDGCNDWGGPGEQADVKAAVEWAASQPWSTGKVGMYGKSYDAWTGLMGIAQQPAGLAGVVSQEPVVDGYRYLYMNRVRFSNAAGTPTLFQAIDATPGSLNDTPEYNFNGLQKDPTCAPLNISEQQQNDPTVPFWQARNLLPATKGKRTPLFMTQGYLETNTKPDGVFELYNGLAGPKRAWFGQFDHVRGTDVEEDGRFAMGRPGFIDETMRFFDRHVAGLPEADAPTGSDPAIAVQGADGRYRAETAWPPADVVTRTSALNDGDYIDDGRNTGTGEASSGRGLVLWTFSAPLAKPAHLAGTPRITLDALADTPNTNLTANVYDVAPDRMATMISRGTRLVTVRGRQELELYGQDWPIAAGHRIGVSISSSNAEWFEHVPTGDIAVVENASIDLPFLPTARDAFIAGGATSRLERFLEEAPFEVPETTIAAFEDPSFAVVAAEPAAGNGSGGGGNQAGPGSGGGPAGGGTAAAAAPSAPAGGAATKTAARARLTLSLGTNRKRGRRIRVRARCSERCSLTGRLTQRRRGRTVTVGRFTRRTVAGRYVTVVRLSRSARRGRAALRVVATTADGRRATLTRRVALRP